MKLFMQSLIKLVVKPLMTPLQFNYLLLFIVFTLANGCFAYNNPDQIIAEQQDKKRILLLNSYNQGYQWSDNIVRAIEDKFKDNNNVVLNVEYMDTKMISTREHYELLNQLYKNKYAQYTIDVIISSDDNALKFLREYREELFPGVPVVFCGVNNFNVNKVMGFKNYTGINEESDFVSSFELILKLHPNVKKLYVINDNITSARAMQTEFFEALKEYEDKFDFEILSDFSLRDLIKKVSSLEKDSVVFYLSFFKDNTGRYLTPAEVIPYISKASPVPIYALEDHLLDYGIVGGMLRSGYSQGKWAANAAQNILQGISAEKIPVMLHNTSVYMFDYNQLKRFNIDPSNLPQGSDIINYPGY